MVRICFFGGFRSTVGCLSGKSFVQKMKTRITLAVVTGMALAGLTTLLLNAFFNCPVQWSARDEESYQIARRDTFSELLRNALYNNGDNASLLVGGIMSVQNRNSALRGLLAASHSSLSNADLEGVDPSSSWAIDEFQRAVTDEEKKVFVDLLRVIDDVTTRHNITYFMTFGTMLGSFRHHDMTPWDDDADVAIPYRDKAAMWMLLNGLGLGYVVNVTADTQFRLVGRRSRLHSSSWEWRWPYVDIDFYSENDTHVWVYSAGKVLRYDRDTLFPLHRRPLGSVSLNSPRDGLTYLKLTYDDYTSCSTGMQHKYGRNRPSVTIPCSVFNETYPFVHRGVTWDQKVMETLKLGSKVLYSMTVDEPMESAAINPFTLSSE